jgi:hypothetical protein
MRTTYKITLTKVELQIKDFDSVFCIVKKLGPDTFVAK